MSKTIFGSSLLIVSVLSAAFAVTANADYASDSSQSSRIMQLVLEEQYMDAYVIDPKAGTSEYYGYASNGSDSNFTRTDRPGAYNPGTITMNYSKSGKAAWNQGDPNSFLGEPDGSPLYMNVGWTSAAGTLGTVRLRTGTEGTTNEWADLSNMLNAGGMTWIYYAFGSTAGGPVTSDWYSAAVVRNGDDWQATFLTDAGGIDRTWDTSLRMVIRFGDAPLGGEGAAAPEPATLALFGLGLGGLALARRRRK